MTAHYTESTGEDADGKAHPCGCPADYTEEEHTERHHLTDTPGGY